MNKRLFAAALMAISLLALVASAGAEQRQTLDEEVKLLQASKRDPYTLFFDIKVKSPGVIRVAAEVLSVRPEKGVPSRLVGIGLIPQGSKKIIRQAFFGKKGGKFEYTVDGLDLEKNRGEYRILITNFSTKHAVTARLLSRYPGEETGEATEPAQREKPDLAVGDVRVDDKGCIAVEVVNSGKLPLPSWIWTKKSPESISVMLEIDGKSWGGATIWVIDPNRSLRKPGSRIVYSSNYRVTKPVKVRAVIDGTSQLNEEDERNNVKQVVLKP